MANLAITSDVLYTTTTKFRMIRIAANIFTLMPTTHTFLCR
jgi:hypothetical protein